MSSDEVRNLPDNILAAGTPELLAASEVTHIVAVTPISFIIFMSMALHAHLLTNLALLLR